MPDNISREFRAIHMPRRRRDAENAVDGAPIRLQGGELVYDYEYNQLYAGLDDNSSVPVGGVGSNVAGIDGASAITNIVAISQEDYDALANKDASTIYIIT